MRSPQRASGLAHSLAAQPLVSQLSFPSPKAIGLTGRSGPGFAIRLSLLAAVLLSAACSGCGTGIRAAAQSGDDDRSSPHASVKRSGCRPRLQRREQNCRCRSTLQMRRLRTSPVTSARSTTQRTRVQLRRQTTGVRSPAQERDAALPVSARPCSRCSIDPGDAPPGDDPSARRAVGGACGQGSASACNALLFESPAASDYEAFAFSCGGRENLHCSVLLGDPGADAGLSRHRIRCRSLRHRGTFPNWTSWWAACADGSSRACAQLVLSAPGGSAYASYGWTCGGRTTRDCALLVGDDGCAACARRPVAPGSATPATIEYLDQLCGSAAAPPTHRHAATWPPSDPPEATTSGTPCHAAGEPYRACARLFAELSADLRPWANQAVVRVSGASLGLNNTS